jgi:post-segregation antitoxin (ccd killing protein)
MFLWIAKVSTGGLIMGTITIGRNGVEFVHTNVIVPRHLRDLAKERGVSMSRELRTALETKMREGSARDPLATNTVVPASTSSTLTEASKNKIEK